MFDLRQSHEDFGRYGDSPQIVEGRREDWVAFDVAHFKAVEISVLDAVLIIERQKTRVARVAGPPHVSEDFLWFTEQVAVYTFVVVGQRYLWCRRSADVRRWFVDLDGRCRIPAVYQLR